MNTPHHFVIDKSKKPLPSRSGFFVFFKEKTMKKTITIFCALLIILGTSCSNNDDDGDQLNCTDIFVFGLTVSVFDETTGDPINVATTVTASDGSYSETLENFGNPGVFSGAGERAGTYTVRVSAEGYESFVSEEITVSADQCHVIPEAIEVRLTPS